MFTADPSFHCCTPYAPSSSSSSSSSLPPISPTIPLPFPYPFISFQSRFVSFSSVKNKQNNPITTISTTSTTTNMIRSLAIATAASLFTCGAARNVKGTQEGVDYKVMMNRPGATNKWYHPAGQWKFEYFSDTLRYTYADATQFCADRNSEVATVQSEQDMEYMLHTMKNNRHGFWGGAVRDDTALGVTGPGYGFSWADGSAITYANWAEGQSNKQKRRKKLHEPNSGRNRVGKWDESCLVVGFNNGNPTWWNDASCELKRRVVCKRTYTECQGVADAPYCAATLYNNIDAGKVVNPADLRTVEQNCGLQLTEFPGCEPGKTKDVYGDRIEDCSWVVAERCQIECSMASGTPKCSTTSTTAGPTSTTTLGPSTTTTPGPSTTTTPGPSTTTTPGPTSTTTVETSTTTPGPTSTTTPAPTTTSTFRTTTTTKVPYTTTSTTQLPETSTTAEPTTIYRGPCGTKGWSDEEATEAGVSCCYKYMNKPRLPWNKAEEQCKIFGDMYQNVGVPAEGHLATSWNANLNQFFNSARGNPLAFNQRDMGGSTGYSQSAWLGGKMSTNNTVNWVNPMWKYKNGDYITTNSEFVDDMRCNAGRDRFGECNNATAKEGNNINTMPERNGMFYKGEPSGLSDNFGYNGLNENCLAMGSSAKSRTKNFGNSLWNDAVCTKKKSYMCEFCMITPTTTTAAPTSTTTPAKSTSTTEAPTTTTTTPPTTSTTEAPTSTTTEAPTTSTTEAPTSTTTPAPTTSTTAPYVTTTTAAPACGDILCGADCGWPAVGGSVMPCGWSSSENVCKEGGTTKHNEKHKGLCASTLPPPTTMSNEQQWYFCGAINCASDCKGIGFGEENPDRKSPDPYGCGWSKKNGGKCLPAFTGARTNANEKATKC